MSPGRFLDRIPTWLWVVLILAAGAASFRLGLGVQGGAPAPSVRATTAGNTARGSIGDYQVRLADGALVRLAPAERPAVVMVSSVSCSVCAEAMRDVAQIADGQPLPHLRVVSLEGAAEGAPMLAEHGLARAWHAGPADGSGQTLLTFQFPGTPTFLLVEPDGRVTRALVGYPGREQFEPWLRVMTGERAAL